MLNVPAPTRIAIGTVEIAGKRYEVFVSVEWARYFQQLNTQTESNAEALNASQAHSALLNDEAEAPDVFPGPPGPRGSQGDPGLALFMLQDAPEDQPLLVRPSVDLSSPPPIGNGAPAAGSFTTLTASSGFGCNGKTAQTAAASGGTLAGVIAALVANGILSS